MDKLTDQRYSSSHDIAVMFDDASFAYGNKTVLSHISGKVYSGQALALIGPNGSGKTTLLRSLVGSVRVCSGSVSIFGHKPASVPKGTMAYVPQAADLDPTFPVRVYEVVQMGLYPRLGFFHRVTRKIRETAIDALDQVGLKDRAYDRFGELSGGQQQRVLVARCVAAKPRIILLDEPFNGLDQPNRDALLRIVTRVKESGIAVIVSTHDLVIAQEVCEQVALLAGRQIGFGPRATVLTKELISQAYGGSHDSLLSVDN